MLFLIKRLFSHLIVINNFVIAQPKQYHLFTQSVQGKLQEVIQFLLIGFIVRTTSNQQVITFQIKVRTYSISLLILTYFCIYRDC